MNIFILDKNPKIAAQLHCDKHVVKMILETAQILSTTILHYRPECEGLYKSTHLNHPCSIWARECFSNFEWLTTLGKSLVKEHLIRYSPKKIHASFSIIRRAESLGSSLDELSLDPQTPFVQAMPDKYRSTDAVKAYRSYYRGEKSHFATWRTPRTKPTWMEF